MPSLKKILEQLSEGKDLSSITAEGKKAGEEWNGKTKPGNPYHLGTEEANAWKKGFELGADL